MRCAVGTGEVLQLSPRVTSRGSVWRDFEGRDGIRPTYHGRCKCIGTPASRSKRGPGEDAPVREGSTTGGSPGLAGQDEVPLWEGGGLGGGAEGGRGAGFGGGGARAIEHAQIFPCCLGRWEFFSLALPPGG